MERQDIFLSLVGCSEARQVPDSLTSRKATEQSHWVRTIQGNYYYYSYNYYRICSIFPPNEQKFTNVYSLRWGT